MVEQQEQQRIKLVFVGDTFVGKSSIILTWTQEKFPALHEPTVLDTWIGPKTYKGTEMNLMIFDTAGHDDLGRIRPIAYQGTDCFLVCYATNDRNSFKNATTKWLSEIKSCATAAPCILVGTKSDLRAEAEVQSQEEIKLEGSSRVNPNAFVSY